MLKGEATSVFEPQLAAASAASFPLAATRLGDGEAGRAAQRSRQCAEKGSREHRLLGTYACTAERLSMMRVL